MEGQEDRKDAECFRHYFQAKSDARGLSWLSPGNEDLFLGLCYCF